ncbi:MAG: ArsA family ATPase [Chloroflexi bacterium]|nr:ArsA family ATPase [Chloroflexota bacterium]
MRILFYTGKGGVGKTSIAAATAVRCADLGYRTVVLSTDLAHSLADSLDVRLGPEPREVTPHLWAQETDIHHNLQTHWGTVQEWLTALLAWQGVVDSLVADELTVLPGMDELANLLWINRHREAGSYDVIVVDAAPTGETLRLLSFPDVLRWWMEHIFPVHRRAMGMARPLMSAFVNVPLPSERVYDNIKELYAHLDQLHRMLVDPELTSVRQVLNPEKMVVAEAQRTHAYLQLFGYPTDLVVVNRVLPPEVVDPFFAAWKDTQATYLRQIAEGFQPLPIRTVPLFENEVLGLGLLRRMGEALYGRDDPTHIFFRGRTQTVERGPDGTFELVIPLQFAARGDVQLRQTGDELYVRVGAHRRHIVLPRALAGRHATGAKLDGPARALRVRFGSSAGDRATPAPPGPR